MNDSPTIVKVLGEDGTTVRAPSADLTVIRSQSDAATFVKLVPEVSSQQSLHGLTAQHTPVLSSEFKSETLSQLKTLLVANPSQEIGISDTSSEKIGPAARPVEGIANAEAGTRQSRGRSWLIIALAVLLAFALITGSFVFAQLPAHRLSKSTNNTGALAQLPTTTPTGGGPSSKNLAGKISPTATLKLTPIPGAAATVDTLPNATAGSNATATAGLYATATATSAATATPSPSPTATATATPSPTSTPIPPPPFTQSGAVNLSPDSANYGYTINSWSKPAYNTYCQLATCDPTSQRLTLWHEGDQVTAVCWTYGQRVITGTLSNPGYDDNRWVRLTDGSYLPNSWFVRGNLSSQLPIC